MALTTIIPNTLVPFAKPQSVSHLSNGISTDIHGVQFPLQVGVPVQNIYTFKIVPAPVSSNCIAPAASYFGSGATGGSITLNTTTQGTGANITATPLTFLGQRGLLLDCERYLQITFSTATLAASVMTITGYDYRGVKMVVTQSLTLGSTSQAVGLPICVVTNISFSVNPFVGNGAATLAIGTNSYIGLPYALKTTAYVVNTVWNNAALSASSGTTVAAFNWRALTTFSNLNCPARGFVNVGTNAPDGTRQLVITYYVYGPDSELDGEVVNLNQSSLKIANIQKTASSEYPNPVYVMPALLDYDLTGVQINPGLTVSEGASGDSAFYLSYYTKCNA